MQLDLIAINCQDPIETFNVKRVYQIVDCSIDRGSSEYDKLMTMATGLAKEVNPGAANDAATERGRDRLILDAFGGVLAEEGWIQYINSAFGAIAERASFTSLTSQIDIKLSNGELIEVRSSFPRNGVKFAICSLRYNFRNLGPYSNSIKPAEIQKHLYLGVLFETQKDALLTEKTIHFSLVGGSTWQMMVDQGRNVDLVPEDGFVKRKSRYRVIEFRNALDAQQVVAAISSLGYTLVT